MNGKVSKFLRSIDKDSKADRRRWNKLSHTERGKIRAFGRWNLELARKFRGA